MAPYSSQYACKHAACKLDTSVTLTEMSANMYIQLIHPCKFGAARVTCKRFNSSMSAAMSTRASKSKDHEIGRSPYFYETKSGDFLRELFKAFHKIIGLYAMTCVR